MMQDVGRFMALSYGAMLGPRPPKNIGPAWVLPPDLWKVAWAEYRRLRERA